jgi:hypothetical protein
VTAGKNNRRRADGGRTRRTRTEQADADGTGGRRWNRRKEAEGDRTRGGREGIGAQHPEPLRARAVKTTVNGEL